MRIIGLGIVMLASLSFNACQEQNPIVVNNDKPKRTLKEYFDKKYLLYKLPDDFYTNNHPNSTFEDSEINLFTPVVSFQPLGYDTKLNLQYTHVYSDKCLYHTADTVWKYAEVCFPNTCLTKDNAYAVVKLQNDSKQTKTYHVRLFYQNSSYWFPTDSGINRNKSDYLDNYYGASSVVNVNADAGKETEVKIPYSIGMNPKGEFDYDPSKDPARPGNYEFMVLVSEKMNDLLDDHLDLKKVNPFAEVKKDEFQKGAKKYFNNIAYVGPHHFKFVFLDEYFDGTNDLNLNHVYVVKNGREKKLCDTCTGWYKAVINENWNNTEFFEGYIHRAYFVKANYGIKKENCHIDSNGITINIPKSRRGDYKKTWGEFLFGPSFKYGHLTVHGKFAMMTNKHATVNGIIHNIWLYQRDPEPVDTSNPFHWLTNASGRQPFEIDFEIWSSSLYDSLTLWDDESFINYSIVDYMRDPNIKLKPGEQKKVGYYNIERYNRRQASVIGEEYHKEFFNYYHTLELYWYPDHLRFMLDGMEKAVIPADMAKIPDKHLFLWIGSPIYQDGTYYQQSFIPFLKEDKKTLIDYIRIE